MEELFIDRYSLTAPRRRRRDIFRALLFPQRGHGLFNSHLAFLG